MAAATANVCVSTGFEVLVDGLEPLGSFPRGYRSFQMDSFRSIKISNASASPASRERLFKRRSSISVRIAILD